MENVVIVFLKLFSITTLATFTIVVIQLFNNNEMTSFYEDAYLHKIFE